VLLAHELLKWAMARRRSGRRSFGHASLEQPGCSVNFWLWPDAASAAFARVSLAGSRCSLPAVTAYSRPNHTTSNAAQVVPQVSHLP
jgi:hypothetical protein